jgi:hypothetical protein
MEDTQITAREIIPNSRIYKAFKTNLKTKKDFHNAMESKTHNGAKYEYRWYEDKKFVASFKSNLIL